jgi:hypothetical protein
MGNHASLSERCVDACSANRPEELNQILRVLQDHSTAEKLSVLEAKDKVAGKMLQFNTQSPISECQE